MRGPSFCIALISAVALAAGAGAVDGRADGLPVLGVDVGRVGVTAPSGAARYVTIPAGRDTIVARIEVAGGRVLGSRLVRGTFTIPAVAYDGSAAGLSADGRRLVLIQPRVAFPRARTHLAVLDTRRLRPLEVVTLRGDFSFDAVSPGGTRLYLIQYVSPTDPTRYLVRAYDLPAGRLLAAPIVDPREPGEKMRGNPLTRAASPDGRWAYTLYDGAGKEPFVHALDTGGLTARCIDLDLPAGTNLSQLRLQVGVAGKTLTVRDGRRPVAVVDTRTFRASAPPVASPPARSGGVPWPLVALGAAVLATGGAVSVAVRRRPSSSLGTG